MLQAENREQTNRVRQGVTGHNVRTVLIAATIGVIIVFALAYFAFFTGAPNPTATG